MKYNKIVMKLALLIILVFFFGSTTTFAIDYSAADIDVNFTVPEGWIEKPLSKDRDFIKVKYVYAEGNGETILFGYANIWDDLPESEKSVYSKADYNNSTFSKSDIAEMFATTADEVSMVTFNEVEYFKCTVSQSFTVSNQSVKIDMLVFLVIKDGIMYQFQYTENAVGENHYSDFETLLNSVVFPESLSNSSTAVASDSPVSIPTKESDPIGFSTEDILLSLLLTIFIYTIPVLILRYAILKKPVEHKKAKKITVIYAIIAFILMSVIISLLSGGSETATGGGLFLWSFVNYKILIGGRTTQK